MANITVKGAKVERFQGIEENDLAAVGGGAGAADLVAMPFTLMQQGIGLISSIASGVVGTLGTIAMGMAERLQSTLGGIFNR